MRRIYEDRHRLVVDAVTRSFADELELVPSAVGLHVAALARRTSVAEIETVLQQASQRGVACIPLSMYAAGATQLAGLALGYGSITTERIEEGLAVLRRAFTAVVGDEVMR
jgi:GntR family transcriptional regulator/MocR family aminotransferase